MTSHWRTTGARYERAWGGRTWSLSVDAAEPGLLAAEDEIGPVLALDGLSARGRTGPDTLGGASLIAHESRFDRVEAVYAPAGWASLRVRATWTPRGDDILDLEVQVQAFTVDELEAVEVHVASRLGTTETELFSGVEPARFNPGMPLPIPPGSPSPPLLARPGAAERDRAYYLEFIHPDDGTRREDGRRDGRVGYALFGYDLERGVVLRSRLRGIWLPRRPDEQEVARRFEEFVGEPPPLGT